MNESDYVSILAMMVSAVALLFAYRQFRLARENFSFAAFVQSLDQLGTGRARNARSHVFQNFPDYSEPNQDNEQTSDSRENRQITFWVRSDNKKDARTVAVKQTSDLDIEMLREVAVRFDRVGFMFYELNLPSKLRNKYLSWMCPTICDLWNRTGPHIQFIRKQNVAYCPYFEKLAYNAYTHYKKKKENARLVCLNAKCN